MIVRNLHWPEEESAVLDLLRMIYGPDEYDLLATWYGHTPAFNPRDCFVASTSSNDIVGHAMIIPRQLQIGESVLPAAEIGVFGVLEDYQGLVENDLLYALHDRMDERGDALSISFGTPFFFKNWQYEYGIGLYLTNYESEIETERALKAGHWNMGSSYDRRTADRLGAHNQQATVRRFYLDDLPNVQALYHAESVRGHYMMARDDETWAWQLDHLTRIGRNDPDDFLVAEIDGQLHGYVRVVSQTPINMFGNSNTTRFSVIEACGSDPDSIEALLGAVGHMAQTFAVDRIGLFVHPESAFMRHALARGAARRAFTGAGGLRLHNFGETLHHLGPALETRRLQSRYATRSYRLIIFTEHEQADLYLGMGDPEIVELEIPSTALIRLITGWYGIDHLTTGYHERYTDFLRVLFPQRSPKIGLADLI